MKKNTKDKNIEWVVKDRICTGCAACSLVCPKECISIEENKRLGIYEAVVKAGVCDNCGACGRVCPQVDIISRGAKDSRTFLGKHKFCFEGYAKDNDLRYMASSGGMVTALCKFTLEAKLADGIISVGPIERDPTRFEARLVTKTEEITGFAGSKYCPVPVNRILKGFIKKTDTRRYVYVGLPCHILGLRRFFSIKPEFASKIKYVLGLFCSHAPNLNGTEFMISKHGINVKDVKGIRYRGQGWPGDMRISSKKQDPVRLRPSYYWGRYFGNHFFTPKYCLVCDDFFGLGSDISFGDALLDKHPNETYGVNVGIARTEEGRALLESAKENGIVAYNNIDMDEMVRAKYGNVFFKNTLFCHRKDILMGSSRSKRIPLKYRMYNRMVLFNSYLSGNRLFVWLAVRMPRFIETLYFKCLGKIKNTLTGGVL